MSPPSSAIGGAAAHGDLAIFISQSGETADALAALRYAKTQGAHTLSVVNVPTSTIARESEIVLPTLAGPEIGVASTKAFTCQLMVLATLAVAAGEARGELSGDTPGWWYPYLWSWGGKASGKPWPGPTPSDTARRYRSIG